MTKNRITKAQALEQQLETFKWTGKEIHWCEKCNHEYIGVLHHAIFCRCTGVVIGIRLRMMEER